MKLKLKNLISGYERVGDGIDSSDGKIGKRRFFKRKLSGSAMSRSSLGGAGRLARVSDKMFAITSYTSSRAYGAFLLTFAVLTMLLNSGANLFVIKLDSDKLSLLIGAISAVLSIPFFFLEGPLSPALERHRLSEQLFFEFFCIKRPSKADATGGGIPTSVLIAAGVLFAVLGYFTTAPIALLLIIGAVFAYLSFISPEFSLFSCILILPSISMLDLHNYVAPFVAVIMLLSYLRKVAIGKRIYNFEQYDALISLMMLCVIASGIFVGGRSSFNLALVIFGSTFVYFATGNLITNPRLVNSMVNALVFSSVLPCAVGAVQFAVSAVRIGIVDTLKMGVSATFNTPDAFAAYLTVPICFSLMFASHKRSAVYVAALLLNCAVMIMTGNFIAPIALILAIFAFVAMRGGRRAIPLALLLMLLPYALVPLGIALPVDRAVSFIIGDSLSQTLAVWSESVELFIDNALLGVGISHEAFSSLISGEPDARNFFLDIAVKSGAPTLLIFAVILLVRLKHRAIYRRYLQESSVGALSATASISAMALVIFGAFNAVFSEISLYYVFFSVFAIGSATLRIACDEHDDRIAYFADARRTYSAAVDLDLR